jgi:hypothetical protein
MAAEYDLDREEAIKRQHLFLVSVAHFSEAGKQTLETILLIL